VSKKKTEQRRNGNNGGQQLVPQQGSTDRKCFECSCRLVDRLDRWVDILGSKSVYCSIECIAAIVERALKVIPFMTMGVELHLSMDCPVSWP
jgi:hypothetical protein